MIQPMPGNVLVVLKPDSDRTESGVFLPQRRAVREWGQWGLVVKVGGPPLTRKGAPVASELQPGDLVVLKRHRGRELRIDGVLHYLGPEEHVLAKWQ